MTFTLASISDELSKEPPRILIYGVHGIGKSTFGAGAPDPVVIQTENGLANIKVKKFPLAKSYDDVIEQLGVLAADKHDHKTLMVDSADWLERLIWDKVCKDAEVKSIEQIGYGKGYIHALTYWQEYVRALNYLREQRNMMIIQTAHAEIKAFNAPDTDSYDRYFIKLHKTSSALIQEFSDCVFFVNYVVHVVKEDQGFNKKKSKAKGGDERIIYARERPAFSAKNRYGLPDTVPFDQSGVKTWSALAEHIPYFQTLKTGE